MANVMIVDDNAAIRLLLTTRLRQADHRVVSAASGEEALSLLAEKGAPDVLVTDVSMPGMSGLELYAKLRQEAAYAHIPIIFLSARVKAADVAFGNELGAAAYLTKPAVISALKCAIDAATANTVAPSQGFYTVAPSQGGVVSEPGDSRLDGVLGRLGELPSPDTEEDREFFGELWATFASHAPAEIEALEDALRRESVGEAEKLAHCLKGSAQNLGGTALAQHLLGVELDAIAGAATDPRVAALIRREYDLLALAYFTVLRDGDWRIT